MTWKRKTETEEQYRNRLYANAQKRYEDPEYRAKVQQKQREYNAKQDKKARKEYDAARYLKYKKYKLMGLYGITQEDFDKMYEEQNGLCAICQKPPTPRGKQRMTLCVDHCHETNQIRQLLCWKCNSMIGHAEDNSTILLSAAKYVEKHKAA